ncbi:MAG: aldo/keto reductase [Bacteroidales bacterium]|nr:aldo/keto reductase [Bacteroidales bacterium]
MKLNNGIDIPSMGFGTFLAPEGDVTKDAVRCAIETGYTLIDTAAVYKNEKSVGRGIQESGVAREQLFVTSKLWNTERGYDTTLRAFEKTMSDLQLEYLDLYLIHWPANKKQFGDANDTINQETWRAFETLHKEGRIRAIGLSNFMPHHLQPILDKAVVMPAVNQIEYHPGMMQKECVEFCQRHDIAVEAWSPLGRGRELENPLLKQIAGKYECTVAQLIITWVMQHNIIPLVKSVHPERIKENFALPGVVLTPEEMAVIDALQTSRVGSDPDTCDF